MQTLRRLGAGFGALFVASLSSCIGSDVVLPDVDSSLDPAFAISDGANGGSDDFYFLPELVDQTPSIDGRFNPHLLPEMHVCHIRESELGDEAHTCANRSLVADFPEGSATVDETEEKYTIEWNTDGPETTALESGEFYLLEILVAGSVMGWIELVACTANDTDDVCVEDDANPEVDAFRVTIGETISVNFWLSRDILCDTSSFVTECITGAVVDQDGADLALEDEGDKLGVIIFQNSLPEPHDQILLTLERIDPDLFLDATGEECIPGIGGAGRFDAPQYGDDCFRLTTTPEITDPLLVDALISICLDVSQLGLTAEEQDQLTMTRYNDSGESPVWEALPDAAGDCPTQTASLLDVPEGGLLRYAAMGLNAVADFIGPKPLAAEDLRLGGLSSSFSRFRYTRPGQMVFTAGDGVVLQAGDDNTVPTTVNVVDHEGLPIANALVHLETAHGTLSSDQELTNADGDVTVSWTVDVSSAGDKTLTASALGLLAGPMPEHSTLEDFFYTTELVTATVTVVGPPSNLEGSPSEVISAIAGESQELTVTVTDEIDNSVEGATLDWTCSPTCDVPATSTTGPDGTTVIQWVPFTSGSQSSTATIDGLGVTFNASVSPAAAAEPTWPTPPATGTAGQTLDDPLVVTVTDAFGNAREGDVVEWTVGSGSGSVSAISTTVGADGTTQVFWTLDETAGENTLTVSLVGTGFSRLLTVTGEPGPVANVVGTGSGQTGTVGETLANPLTVTVTDQFDNPIPGETVTFGTADGGSFDPSSATTDAAGQAGTSWTLGTIAGTQSATAGVGSFAVDYTATVEPAAPADLNASPSEPQAAFVGTDIALSILVEDEFGNAVPNETVIWAVTEGGGSVSDQDGTTASDGNAGATWTLGALPGTNTATVTVGSLSATFTATGECLEGWGTSTVDGFFGDVEWACAGSESFTAKVSGGSTPAEVHWMNDSDNLYLAVRVQQSSFDKANDVRFDFDNDGDGAAAVGDDAIGHNSGSFIDEWLDQKCFDKSQSGCGTPDQSVNGSSALDNDGAWTVFELSHPLSGDATREDFVRSAGQALGFFLSLQQGNGAQGNTQWPGFRDYEIIGIVGPPSS